MARKFYRTTIEVEVLSEDAPVSDSYDLSAIAHAITDGDWSGDICIKSTDEMTGLEAANALRSQGSDPAFFMLDDAGADVLD